ncbi:MAG: DUF3093 domain-containing protein [Actinobacteria bacterium]|nr:DUF3093 domain-containing protein [Actinomycetota bacterium]MCA1719715.1 DUF3093 domain-containing protein [Actinomycetota bacterium]
MTFRERWVVPWWWWPAALGLATLVAAELHSGAPGTRAVLPYAVLLPLTLALLALGSRGRVTVLDGVLSVPGARIGLEHLGDAVALDREQLRRQAGPNADRHAFLVSRPWLHSAVRVLVADPADDTPYWIIGTRDPAALLAALRR